MESKKYGTNEPIYKQKQIHRYREQTCGCQRGGHCRRVGRFKLLHLGWISSKGPTVYHGELYSIFWGKP